MTAVTVRVPAKVNLQLAVGPAREDGYHDLVNVFHAVSLFDEVTVTAAVPGAEGAPVRLRIEGDLAGEGRVPLGRENLAVRAAELLARRAGHIGPVEILLRKNIPVAGGMAGGSADAAATLVACDTLWGTGLPEPEMAGLAAELGSDVPFALIGGTAVGRGRGEDLTPALCRGTFHWVFALAEGGLSTAEVYREYDRVRPAPPAPQLSSSLMTALANGDAPALGAALANDLQPAALNLRPQLRRTLVAGEAAGALGAIVSGSGPTCAFLAADADHARRVATVITECGEGVRTVRAHGPVPGATVVEAAPQAPA